MKARHSRAVLVVTLIGAVLGLVFLFNLDPGKDPVPSLDLARSQVTEEQLAGAAGLRVFFGHMSVGANVLSGLETLYAAKGLDQPTLIEIDKSGPIPELPAGVIVHTAIGENGDPFGKLRNFDAVLRSGLADEVDVAILKFCYVDFSQDTDVDALHDQYRKTLDTLERDYPKVKFLHATAPLMVRPSGVKERLLALMGRDDNLVRERYSARLRADYPADRLFDIAAVEAGVPEGTSPGGPGAPALSRGYTTDGGHLNEPASALAAAALVKLLAAGAAP